MLIAQLARRLARPPRARARLATGAALTRPAASARPRAALSARALSAAVRPFQLADIGEGISEVEIIEWAVAAGGRRRSFT